MRTTSIILLTALSLSSLGADRQRLAGPSALIKKGPTNKELRTLLRLPMDGGGVKLAKPPKPAPNIHDGMIITGDARFVRETKEALNRMKKQAPAVYNSARRHVKEIKHLAGRMDCSHVHPWRAWSGTINMTDRDCLYDNYGFWFDAVICHEMQHQDWGDAQGVVYKDFSAPGEPAARWATYIICAHYVYNGKIAAISRPYLTQMLRGLALSSGYSEYKWANRYNKLSCK